MRVKCLVRNPDNYMRETKRDIFKVPRNYDPTLHPFQAAREYKRALNAVKLEKVFAKPFVGNLDGHKDGVSCLTKHPAALSLLASGAFDGEVRLWNIPTKKKIRNVQAHDGGVRGICFVPDGSRFFTIGDDKTLKMWGTEGPDPGVDDLPLSTIISKDVLLDIHHSGADKLFATSGEVCKLWEESRSEPLRTMAWGADSTHHIKFNPVDKNLLIACGNDRSIILFDLRDKGPVRKLILAMKTNQISWNPMEAFNFTAANEDYQLYTYDIRNFTEAQYVHFGHTSSVICVDYSPTGQEFVSGSYDKTIRIFKNDSKYSREIYHTKRMQRLTAVQWSLDDKYVLSGSDEMNIRIWKARASEKLGIIAPREQRSRRYNDALINKFSSFPEIKKIKNFRHIPKHVYNAKKEHDLIRSSRKRKEENRRKHSKPGSVPVIPEEKQNIVSEIE